MTDRSDALHFHYDVDGNNFTSAGEASVQVKRMLRQMGYHPDLIRRISVAMLKLDLLGQWIDRGSPKAQIRVRFPGGSHGK